MAVNPEYKIFVEELLADFRPVSIRAMFGGAGVYADGVMFGLIAYETLYFKVDESNKPDYEAEGSEPFSYEGKGKSVSMSYWSVPERLYDEPEEISEWATKSLDVAQKAKSKSKPKSGGKKKKP